MERRAESTGRRRTRPVVLLLLYGLGSPLIGAAQSPELEADAVLQRLQGWLDVTVDMQGRFEQELVSGAMGAGLEERGRFWVERPGKMRWNYLEPERKVAIVAGDRTWLYVEADRQLILGRLGEGNDLISALLAGRAGLQELFEASLVATPRLGGDGAYRLRLEPRSSSDALEQVVVTSRPPEFAIEAAEVLDAAGNRIVYRFRRLKRNRGLPPDLFEFVPPPGTEIAGGH